MDSGDFDWSTFEKTEIHHSDSENEEKKMKNF